MTPNPRGSSGLAVHNLLYALLGVGLAVVLLLQMMGGDDDAESTGQSEAAPPAADATLMDPTAYRTAIQQIEAVLYKEEEAGMTDADEVSRYALQLGTQLLRAPSRLQGQRAGQEVMAFSNLIGQQADVGYATLNLPQARSDWEKVRDKVFVRAPWFRTGR